jgi:hypothetical protein
LTSQRVTVCEAPVVFDQVTVSPVDALSVGGMKQYAEVQLAPVATI